MTTRSPFALIVHGGAGRFAEDERASARLACERAARAGADILRVGGSALDAVTAAVRILEDDPLFNAGTGAVLNSDGDIELDASIMSGHDLRAGAVAAVREIANPILLARKLLETGPPVLLVGAGAHAFAHTQGFVFAPAHTLITPRQAARWRAQHGTVGAVARDGNGHIAAATSTGGLWEKLPGRVGDSALIGAGTYADAHAGVSCTGNGEAIIRAGLARMTALWLATGSDAPTAATRAVAWMDENLRADVGVIVVDAHGAIGYARNTEAMAVAFVNADGVDSDL